MKVRCDNCGFEATRRLKVGLEDIPCLNRRLDVGGIVPAGECPECGALAYRIDAVGKTALPAAARKAIEEVLRATKKHLAAICGDGRNLTVYEGLQDVVEGMETSVDKLRSLLGRAGKRKATQASR